MSIASNCLDVGSIQCKSSTTIVNGFSAAKLTTIVVNSCRVRCFWRSGLIDGSGVAIGDGKREQRSQQRQRLAGWQSMARAECVELFKPGFIPIRSAPGEDGGKQRHDRIQRTVGVVRRAAKFEMGVRFLPQVRNQGLHQAGLADSGVT